MTYVQGVNVGDYILEKQYFIPFMTRLLAENNSAIQTICLSVQMAINSGRFDVAYRIWQEGFLQKILHQSPISLLVIDNIAMQNKQKTFYFTNNMGKFITAQGQIAETTDALQKLQVNEILQEHLADFLESLTTTNVNDQDAKIISKQYSKGGIDYKSVVSRAWSSKGRKSIKYVFYKNQRSWEGNAAEAFISHIASRHAALMAQGANSENLQELPTVLQEEKQNIFRLLSQSKNKTEWFRSGDIFIRYKDFVFNAQLKTKAQAFSGGLITHPKYKLAVTNLNKLVGLLNNSSNYNEMANILYESLKTDGWMNQSIKSSMGEIVKNLATSWLDNSKNF